MKSVMMVTMALITGCATEAQLAQRVENKVSSEVPGGISSPSRSSTSRAYEPDDYLADRGSGSFMIAKMVTPPSEATKGEAEFAPRGGGERYWSHDFFHFRAPGNGDFRPGLQAYAWQKYNCSPNTSSEPLADSARPAVEWPWRPVTVAETSDLFKGVVTVDDVNKIRVACVLVKQ